jgi:hypothetical protein
VAFGSTASVSFGATATFNDSVGLNGPVAFGASNTFSEQNTFGATTVLNGPATFSASAAVSFGATATFSGLVGLNGPVTFGASNTFSAQNTFGATTVFNGPVTFGASGPATFGATVTMSAAAALNGPVTFGASNTFSAQNTFGATTVFNAPVTFGTSGPATFGATASFSAIMSLPDSGRFTTTGMQMGASGTVALATGTASVAPLKFALTGAVLTAPSQGAVEFDGNSLFITGGTTTGSGRQVVLASQAFTLTTGGSVIAAGSSVFGNTSRPYLLASHLYSFTIQIFFTKTTAGTITYGFTNTASTNMELFSRVVTFPAGTSGIDYPLYTTGPTGTGNTGSSGTTSVASASIATNTNGYTIITGTVVASSNCRLDLLAVAMSGGGTARITPLAGSNFTYTDISSGNVGNIG